MKLIFVYKLKINISSAKVGLKYDLSNIKKPLIINKILNQARNLGIILGSI